MPSLTEFRHIYEVLIRFNGGGALQGAHVQYLEGVARDGVPIQATPGPALPLSLADAGDQLTLAAVLGEATIAAVEASTSALAELADVRAQLAQREVELTSVRAQLGQREAEIAAVRAQMAQREADLAAVRERLTAAEASLAQG